MLEQANAEAKASEETSRSQSFSVNRAKSSLKTFMAGGHEMVGDDDLFLTKPVADLFPEGKFHLTTS